MNLKAIEGDIKIYKDGNYRFTDGHWKKIKEEKIIENGQVEEQVEEQTTNILKEEKQINNSLKTIKSLPFSKLGTVVSYLQKFGIANFVLTDIKPNDKEEIKELEEEREIYKEKLKKMVKEYGVFQINLKLGETYGKGWYLPNNLS